MMKFYPGWQFNVNVSTDENGDTTYHGDAGEELRKLRADVSAYNKTLPKGSRKVRVGIQGRLGMANPYRDIYKNRKLSSTRIKLKHAAYVGVYIW